VNEKVQPRAQLDAFVVENDLGGGDPGEPEVSTGSDEPDGVPPLNEV